MELSVYIYLTLGNVSSQIRDWMSYIWNGEKCELLFEGVKLGFRLWLFQFKLTLTIVGHGKNGNLSNGS